jgi:hypothetical protein
VAEEEPLDASDEGDAAAVLPAFVNCDCLWLLGGVVSRFPNTGELSAVGGFAADSETVLNLGIPLFPCLAILAPIDVFAFVFAEGLPPAEVAAVEGAKIEPLRNTGAGRASGKGEGLLVPDGRGLAALFKGDDLASEGMREGVDAAETIGFVFAGEVGEADASPAGVASSC